ncbi:MAG TPA: outer membrane protein assembly factor BamA [Planctomycetota bacterium]|nr:outer membrane protein assembly factor BamA [Planctomycetota bacterium]
MASALVALAPGLALSQEPAARKTIRKIAIQGLSRESESEISARLSIQIGDIYDPHKVSLETGKLYATRKFRKVEPPQVTEFEDGVAITFVVEERLPVRAVEFAGRKGLKESELRSAIETKAGALYNESSLQVDREIVLEKYLEAGFIFARVRTEIEESPQGVRIAFIIEEGTRVRIREVRFIGNKAVSSGTLVSLMATRKEAFFGFMSFIEAFYLGLGALYNAGFYDPERLQADLKNIRNYYYRLGYLDVKAELHEIVLDPYKEKMTITIRVEEGPQYTFRGYRFLNNAVFTEQALLNLTTAVPGQPFNGDTVQMDQQEIRNYYGDRAYLDATVSTFIEPTLEGEDVFVRFDIREGHEAYVERVRIEGNIKTMDKIIRRELEFYPGEQFDRSKLNKSRSNLNRLQFFRNVDFSIDPGSSPSNKTVVVKVEEEQSGRLILGFGLTTGFGVIGNFSILKRNFDITDLPENLYEIQDSFTGAGQTLNLQAQPGTRRSLYRFSLTEPYLFETRNALNLAASKLTIIRRDYDEDRASFMPRISHAFDFDRDFVFSVGHRIEEVEVSRVEPDAPTDAFDAEGFTTVIALDAGVSHDKRLFEYLEGSYDGTLNAIQYEYGGGFLGGEIDFHKGQISNEFYYPVFTHGSGPASLHHVISLVNRFGFIEPQHSNDTIPIFEREFLGGANTVRGFRFRGLGPHEGNDPIGGTGWLWGNFEYSFPIFLKLLRGVVFLDYGNLSTDLDSFTFSQMRYSVGGGIRINFPFLGTPLPIGLYLGTPIRKEDDDRKKVFLFTIGAPF